YLRAGAEATGLPAEAFDLVLFSNSLHHVPDPPAALAEARRILVPGGRVAVMEPEGDDALTPVMRFIDDETAVYAAVIAAVEAAVAAGHFDRRQTLRFARRYTVASPEAMLADLMTVDSGRRLAPGDRADFEAAFAAARVRDGAESYIPYHQRIDVLSRRL
ncbi:MAG: class I SAM-dependent methyltransferase, partial [Pseudomonadota bacterium]